MAAGHMVQFGDNIGLSPSISLNLEDDSMSSDEIEELTTILHTLESDQRIYKLPQKGRARKQVSGRPGRYGTLEHQETIEEEEDDDPFAPPTIKRKGRNRTGRIRRFSQDVRKTVARRRSMYIAKAKMVGLKTRALTLLMKMRNKEGMAVRKESRATKLVSIVMVVFLCCWTPFFAINLFKVFSMWADSWNPELEKLFIAFTWLGYLNSCLNPIIYSAINRKFRIAFRKILRCPGEERKKKMIRASQPHGLPTQLRTPQQLPINTTGYAAGSRLGLMTAGSTDQGYVSSASNTNCHGPWSMDKTLGSQKTSPLRHAASSPRLSKGSCN